MSNQISGLISRSMTNSKPQDTTQTNTQSYGLLQQRGDQAAVLDFSPERGDGSGSDERGDVVQPSTRRGDDPRHGWRTHTPANGRSADPRDPDGNVRGLDTARRIHFSSRLTNDPARSTMSADSSPPDRLTSALLADSRRQYLPHLSTTSTTEQTARSTDTQSARRFRTASILNCEFPSVRTADADKTCVLHDFSPLNELISRNSRQPHGNYMTG